MTHQSTTYSEPYNLFSLEAFTDPYPLYHQMRTEAPIYWNQHIKAWVLTRYEDVRTVLINSEMKVFSPVSFPVDVSLKQQAKHLMITEFLGRWVVYQNPPDHRLLRRLLNHGFKPAIIQDLSPRIQTIADEILDPLLKVGTFDMIWDFAFPFAVTVIAEILGVPPRDRPLFLEWAVILRDANNGYIDDPVLIDKIHQMIEEAKTYLNGLLEEHRRTPYTDVISGLITAQEEGRTLEDEDFLSNLLLLLFGGHETTMHMIGNGVLALLHHPDQADILRHNPALIEDAMEELLRYDTSSPLVARIAHADLEIGGQQILAGQRIFLMLGAANRDPIQFPEPDRLDITRQPNRHLVFGQGIHYCLGGELARLEGKIVFSTLSRHLPKLHLATETLTWYRSIAIRGLTTLPVRFCP